MLSVRAYSHLAGREHDAKPRTGSRATSHVINFARSIGLQPLYIATSAYVLVESTQAHLHYQVEYSTKA